MPSTISELSSIPGQVLPSISSEVAESPRGGIEPLLLLKRHLKLAALVFLTLVLLGGLALHQYLKPMYSATSIVYVSPTFPAALPGDREHDRLYDSFIEQQVKAVTRYETLQKALAANPEWKLPKESDQDAILRLENAMKVGQIGRSYEVSISVDSPRPQHLADLVNGITAAYLEATRSDEVYGREQTIATLTGEKNTLQKQLDTAIQSQDQLLQSVGMAHYSGTDPNPYDTHLMLLRQQLADAHEKRAEADAESNSLRSGNAAALTQAATQELSTDSALGTLKTQLETRKAALIVQMSGLTPSNPLYAQSDAEIKDVDRQLEQFTGDATSRTAQQIQRRLLTNQQRAAGLESQLANDIGKTTAQASSAAPRLARAQVLSSEIERIQKDYALIESRIENLTLEGQSPGSVHLFSSALPPTGPNKSKRALYYGALVLMCLFAGAASTLLAEAVDPHVYTGGDVRRVVGFAPIGVLLSPTEFEPEVQKEYFLRLASGLDQAYRRAGARTFVFPSMGQTSTRDLVQLLGSELHATGLHVLVVNVLTATESKEAGPLPPDLLKSEILGLTSGAAALTTEFGEEPYRVVSLPATVIADVLRRSRSYYDTILVAADPLFTSAYTEHFARVADGTVLIVDSGKTRKEELARAARLLERLKIKGIAIVLTGVTEKRADEDVARTIQEYKWKTA